MKRVPIRLGPLALLLTVVTICMIVLGILTFATARADLAMAEKLAASTRERYELEAEGQAFLQTFSQGLPGLELEDGAYWHTLRQGNLRLEIGVKPSGEVVCWQYSGDWQPPQEIGGLWLGG